MAKQTNSNLLERALGVKSELAVGANTASRIGQLLLDILASTAFEWDPDRTYAPGEFVIWDNRNVRCFQPTLKGESPGTHAAKWDDKVISSQQMLLPTGVDYPVLGHALQAYVKSAVEKGGGNAGNGPLKAGEEDMNNLVNNTSYVTPYLVGLVLQQIISLINEIREGSDSLLTIANRASADDLDVVFAKLIAKGKTETIMALCQKLTAIGCGGVAPAVTTHRIRIKKHYEFVNSGVIIINPLTPSYIGRFDLNNCNEFRGWFVDVNNPNFAPTVRIVRDGTVIANLVCSIERTDVRDELIRQGRLPAGSTFATYGYSYVKVEADKNGQAHTFEAFGGTSQTKASTDTGANPTITCGTVVVNPPPTGNVAPAIVGVYNDQLVNVAGDQLLDSIVGLYSDADPLTYSATLANGAPLPVGIVFTPGEAKPFKILATFPNQQLSIKLVATDSGGLSTPKLFQLTVARPVVNDNPVTLTGQIIGGDTECQEGSGARVNILNTLSNGSTSSYNGGGTYSIVAPYPDQMTIRTDANAVGIIDTKETVIADVQVTIKFTFPDGREITGPFTVRNKTTASSPITSYIIDDLTVVEGGQGTSQVYAVHADGSFTEVVQADGSRFELVAPYPNGMSVSYGNTARALVQTAGNSVTANVEVKIRFTFAGGGVVEGKITVQNVNDTSVDPNALSISRMSIYYPLGWHSIIQGQASENVVLLVNVAGNNGANASVQAQYAQSRNDATFGAMQKIDYANNSGANPLPAGFTHYTQFNDEQFSTALRTFRARLVTVSGSQVEASYQAPANTPDHATVQIYPTSN